MNPSAGTAASERPRARHAHARREFGGSAGRGQRPLSRTAFAAGRRRKGRAVGGANDHTVPRPARCVSREGLGKVHAWAGGGALPRYDSPRQLRPRPSSLSVAYHQSTANEWPVRRNSLAASPPDTSAREATTRGSDRDPHTVGLPKPADSTTACGEGSAREPPPAPCVEAAGGPVATSNATSTGSQPTTRPCRRCSRERTTPLPSPKTAAPARPTTWTGSKQTMNTAGRVEDDVMTADHPGQLVATASAGGRSGAVGVR